MQGRNYRDHSDHGPKVGGDRDAQIQDTVGVDWVGIGMDSRPLPTNTGNSLNIV